MLDFLLLLAEGIEEVVALAVSNDQQTEQRTKPASNPILPNGEEVVLPESATIEALLPNPNAQLWVDGKETVSRGATRRYATPPLQTGYQYTSTIKAVWQQDGELRTVERQVPLSANSRVVVDFTQTPSRVLPGPYNRD